MGSLPRPCHPRLRIPSAHTLHRGVLQTDMPLSVVSLDLCVWRDWKKKGKMCVLSIMAQFLSFFSNCCSCATNRYPQCTTNLLESLRGRFEVGCHTRQSSFIPFMFLRGCKEYCEVTTPLSKERLVDWPFRSVSQERRGGGWATERQ